MRTLITRGSPILCCHYRLSESESNALGPCPRDRLRIASISMNSHSQKFEIRIRFGCFQQAHALSLPKGVVRPKGSSQTEILYRDGLRRIMLIRICIVNVMQHQEDLKSLDHRKVRNIHFLSMTQKETKS
jgi:hypothetical protein